MSTNRLEELQIQIDNTKDPDTRATLKEELNELILANRAVLEEEKLLEAHKTALAIANYS